jgi:hypothetical protein
MTTDCPGVATPSPITAQTCTPPPPSALNIFCTETAGEVAYTIQGLIEDGLMHDLPTGTACFLQFGGNGLGGTWQSYEPTSTTYPSRTFSATAVTHAISLSPSINDVNFRVYCPGAPEALKTTWFNLDAWTFSGACSRSAHADIHHAPTTPPPVCTADTWTCTDWSSCSTAGSQTRSCAMTTDCPGVVTASPAITNVCTPVTAPPHTINCVSDGDTMIYTLTGPFLDAFWGETVAVTASTVIRYIGTDGWTLVYPSGSTKTESAWTADTNQYTFRIPKAVQDINFGALNVTGGNGDNQAWFDLNQQDSQGASWTITGACSVQGNAIRH